MSQKISMKRLCKITHAQTHMTTFMWSCMSCHDLSLETHETIETTF
jgi:hypothetical protein